MTRRIDVHRKRKRQETQTGIWEFVNGLVEAFSNLLNWPHFDQRLDYMTFGGPCWPTWSCDSVKKYSLKRMNERSESDLLSPTHIESISVSLYDPEIFWYVEKKTPPSNLLNTPWLGFFFFNIYYCSPFRSHIWQNPLIHIKSIPPQYTLCAHKTPLNHH